jgi:hypothetical protein
MGLPFLLPHCPPLCGSIAFQIGLGKFHGRVLPNFSGMKVVLHFYKPSIHCNQKREGPKTHSTLTAFNEPRRPCSPDLFHTIQTFNLTQHTDCLLIPSDEHHKIKDVQALCFHTTTGHVFFTVSISCLAHSHRCQQQKLSHYIIEYVHSPKAQTYFSIKCSQKH